MERDFMGLNSKDSVVIKQEFVEGGCEDSGCARSSGVPWPLSNKNGHSSAHHIHDFKMHNLSVMSPFLKTHFVGASQNSTMKQHSRVGINPHLVLPSAASVPVITEQWTNPKASTTPAQLTIFYAGTVNVFDDISPGMAHAIMFLAGNGCVPSDMAQSRPHMQPPTSKLPAADRVVVNQSVNMSPCSCISSPMSVTSHSIYQSANNDDVKVSKNVGMSTTLVNQVEPPSRVVSSIGSIAASAMLSSAVPQARKASLARFLEKRKERAMCAAPYNLSKNGADCGTPESNDLGFSATSGISSSSISISKGD